MQAQLIALHSYIVAKKTTILEADIDKYITNNYLFEIYKYAVRQFCTGGEITKGQLINDLKESYPYEKQYAIARGYVERIYSDGISLLYRSSYDIIQALKDEYIYSVRDKLVTDIAGQDTEIEQIETSIYNASDSLSLSSENKTITDFADISIQKQNEIKSGVQSDESKRAIELKSKALQTIFGHKIYPTIVTIQGAPGQGKTTLQHNLVSDFADSGKCGLCFTWEDTKQKFFEKVMAVRSGESKSEIIENCVTAATIRNNTPDRGKILISAAHNEPESCVRAVKKAIAQYKLDYVTIDYIQLVRGANTTDAITDLIGMLTDIARIELIPIIITSQATKAAVNDSKILKGGNEMGSSAIFNATGYAVSVNSKGDDSMGRLVHCYKDRYYGHLGKTYDACFNFVNGRLKNAEEIDK